MHLSVNYFKNLHVLHNWLLLFGVYVLTLGTNFYSSDAEVMYLTGRALTFEQTIFLPENNDLPQIHQNENGHWYSQYDPGLPLISVPIIWITDQVAKQQLWNRHAFSAYALLWISAFSASLAAFSLYHFSRQKKIALIAALCTPLWVYSRLFFAEALLAFLITGAFLLMVRRKPGFAGFLLGVAILTRAAMIIYLVPLLWVMWKCNSDTEIIENEAGGLKTAPTISNLCRGAACRAQFWAGLRPAPTGNIPSKLKLVVSKIISPLSPTPFPVYRERGKSPSLCTGRDLGWGFVIFIFPLIAILCLFYHNFIRTGNPLTFGYGGQAFDTFPLTGIAGLLFSPGKSVFLYAPPLILSVFHWRKFHRREPALAEGMLIATLIALIFYGSWWAWHGGWCWGARFLVPLMPLWCLPLMEEKSKFRLFFFAILGFLINFAGVMTDVNYHYALINNDAKVHYEIASSPLMGAIKAGKMIPLAAFHMQDFGWTKANAILFPVVLSLFLTGMILHECKTIFLWRAGGHRGGDDARRS